MAETYDFSRASVHCMTDSWVLKDGLPKARGEDGVKMSPLYSACPTVVLLGDDGLWFCVNASHDINRLVTAFVNCLWERRLVADSSFMQKRDANGVCRASMDGDLYFAPVWVFELRRKAATYPDLMRMVLGMHEKPAARQVEEEPVNPNLTEGHFDKFGVVVPSDAVGRGLLFDIVVRDSVPILEAYPAAKYWFSNGRDGYGISTTTDSASAVAKRIVGWILLNKHAPESAMPTVDSHGFVKPTLGLFHLSHALYKELRTMRTEEEILAYLRTGQKAAPVPQQITTAHIKEETVPSNVVPALGNVAGTAIQPNFPATSVAPPTYIGGGPSNVIVSGPGGAIFADGRNAVIGGGNSGPISTVAVPSFTFCSADVGPTARRANPTEGKLKGIPSHALVVTQKTDARLGEGGYTLVFDSVRPTTLLRTPLGDVVVHEDFGSNEADVDNVLALCMLYPLYQAAWLRDQGLEQRLGMQKDGIGTWLMQATPSTWARIQEFDERHGRAELVRALMTERTYVRMEEELKHMIELKNAEEAVPHVEGTTTPAVVAKAKRPAKERAKAAAKKAGKDALDDAKEALFRGTVRNTVKEVHGTAITIAKGVTDNDTAMMVVALMETERGKAALAAGFGAILGFMIDMLEGEHPALERVARELKVENGSVLMDPIIGAVLAPLAQLFARVCLMAGDKSAADQVHKLTAPLQLVAAGGTLIADEVRVAEKAVK